MKKEIERLKYLVAETNTIVADRKNMGVGFADAVILINQHAIMEMLVAMAEEQQVNWEVLRERFKCSYIGKEGTVIATHDNIVDWFRDNIENYKKFNP